ncbi:glycerate kinase [bacterium 210820-DFI.6.37]|nr:glycerate kinase [bacterium 210820-DFI.6.37]
MDNEKSKKYLLMPDSFKGTMDAVEVCQIMKASILKHDAGAQVICAPIADGGEGTVDCFLHAFGGEKVFMEVTGPQGGRIPSFYGRIDQTAVVEMAAASGFISEGEKKKDPSSATTYGVGELIRAAVESGSRKIILGLGGSCTNDGGAGMAAALGVKFYDSKGKGFLPTGKSLSHISRIDVSACETLLKKVSIEAMCDIDNPLFGPQGAAYIFAPQKGADAEMVAMLDRNLRFYAEKIYQQLGLQVSGLSGGGAAGGMGAGAAAFLNAELKQGIDVILDMLGFETLLESAEAIFTGEGQLDSQSLGGKAVVGIARRAGKAGVPVIAVAGRIKGEIQQIYNAGVTAIFQTDPGTYKNKEELFSHCREDLKKTMDRILAEHR